MSGASERFQHFLDLHHPEALRARPVEVLRRLHPVPRDPIRTTLRPWTSPSSTRPAAGRPVAISSRRHGVVDVGMGIDVNDPEGVMDFRERAQDGKHDGVVSAEVRRSTTRLDDRVVGPLMIPCSSRCGRC